MPQTRSDFEASVNQQINEVLFENYKPLNEMFRYYLNVVPMPAGAYVKSNSMVGLGMLEEKPEGQDIAEDSISQGYTTAGKARTFAKTVRFSKESVRDDQARVTQDVFDFGQSWAAAYQRTRENLASKIFNFGAFTSGHDIFDNNIPGVFDWSPGKFIYDGKPLFAASGNNHPLKESTTTCYNSLGATAFSATNFATAYSLLVETNCVDERGEKFTCNPNLLMVGSFANEQTAWTTLYSTQVGLTNNADNPWRSKAIQLIRNPFIPANSWVLMDTTMPFVDFLERQIPEIRVWTDNDNLDMCVSVDARFGIHVRNWRAAVASYLPTS